VCRIIPHSSLRSSQPAGILAGCKFVLPLPKSACTATDRPVARLIKSLVDSAWILDIFWNASELLESRTASNNGAIARNVYVSRHMLSFKRKKKKRKGSFPLRYNICFFLPSFLRNRDILNYQWRIRWTDSISQNLSDKHKFDESKRARPRYLLRRKLDSVLSLSEGVHARAQSVNWLRHNRIIMSLPSPCRFIVGPLLDTDG